MTTTINASTSAGLVQTADTSGSLALQTASTTALTLDTSQNATFAGSVKTNTLTSAASTALTLQSAGTTAVTIDTSQNVGIGTTSPSTYSAKLAVVASSGVANQWLVGGASSGAYAYFSNNAQSSTANTMQIGQGWASGSDNIGFLNTNGANPMLFATNGAERMRIDSSGNLLVGQTSSSFGGGICLTKNAVDSIAIFQNTAGNGAQCVRAIIGAGTNNTSSFLFVGSAASQDNIYIYGNGNVVNRNNSYGAISDIKLKENVVDASPKLNDVMQLKVRNFNFKTDPNSKQIGFIAQEFEEVFPSLIDSTTSPNDPDDVTKAIKTSVLVPILVKAIQELKAINDTQAETINALTARIVALEGA